MRQYEVIFIVTPLLSEEDADKVAGAMQKTIERKSAVVEKIEKWGKRRLAYTVEKHKEGYYYLFIVNGSADAVVELERKFKQTDEVIRFITVRMDLEQKAVAKRIARRAKGDAKRPKKSAPAEASSGTAGQEVEEAE